MAFTITVLFVSTLFRMLQFIWQCSIVSPNSSLKYLISDNSPILIMSHFVNNKIKYGARAAMSIQWLVTGCKVWGSNFIRRSRCYLAENWRGGSSWPLNLRLKMSEAILLAHHMLSCHGQNQIYISCFFKLNVHL